MSWLSNIFNSNNSNFEQIDKLELQLDFLKNCTYNDVDFFNLKGWEGWAKVVKLWDGDTFTVVLFVNDKPFKFRIRLDGIDTAEKTSDNPDEVEWAQKAIEKLNEFIGCDRLVYLKCKNFDKYGRVLAQIHDNPVDDTSVNEILLGLGLAYEYHGGKRVPFHEWCIQKTNNISNIKIDNINDSEVYN